MPSVTVNNGITLEYESFGNVGDPAILLVMGLGAQLLLWPDALVEMLVAKGFRVVRFDNRDVGLSTKLDHLGSPSMALTFMKFMMRIPLRAGYKIGDMARDTAGLIEALSLGRTHVVGASMGGMIGQNLAATFPDMVASLTSIMSTTGNRRLPQPTWRARSALLSRPPKPGDVEAGTRHLMHMLRVIGSRTHPAEENYLRNFCERHVRRSFYPPGVARQLLAIAASDDRSATIARIVAPTLVHPRHRGSAASAGLRRGDGARDPGGGRLGHAGNRRGHGARPAGAPAAAPGRKHRRALQAQRRRSEIIGVRDVILLRRIAPGKYYVSDPNCSRLGKYYVSDPKLRI